MRHPGSPLRSVRGDNGGLPKAAVQYEGIVLQGGIRPYRIGPEGLQILPPRPARRGRNRRPRSAPKARRHPGDVMKCHVLSCDVMFRRRAAPFRGPRRSAAVRILHVVPSIAFRSVRAAAGLPAARPCFARIAWARARAFAPARFARLIARACAREPGAGRTSPVRSVGVFSRRREAGDEAASGCRFLLTHLTTILQGSSPYRELFHNS